MKVFLNVTFVFFLLAHASPSSAQEMSLFSFGKGKIQVRLYADYFCGPCSRLEPKAEPLIVDLIKRNIITISFIDVPLHKHSTLYAKYFLYILNDKKTLDHALKARKALFEASKIPLEDGNRLETFLLEKKLKFKTFDTTPVFTIFQNYFREDRINSTPTCVIINENSKDVSNGDIEVIRALERLKELSDGGRHGAAGNKRKGNT